MYNSNEKHPPILTVHDRTIETPLLDVNDIYDTIDLGSGILEVVLTDIFYNEIVREDDTIIIQHNDLPSETNNQYIDWENVDLDDGGMCYEDDLALTKNYPDTITKAWEQATDEIIDEILNDEVSQIMAENKVRRKNMVNIDFERLERQKYNERKRFIRKWKKLNPTTPLPRKRRSLPKIKRWKLFKKQYMY